jgi:hypothetical protein
VLLTRATPLINATVATVFALAAVVLLASCGEGERASSGHASAASATFQARVVSPEALFGRAPIAGGTSLSPAWSGISLVDEITAEVNRTATALPIGIPTHVERATARDGVTRGTTSAGCLARAVGQTVQRTVLDVASHPDPTGESVTNYPFVVWRGPGRRLNWVAVLELSPSMARRPVVMGDRSRVEGGQLVAMATDTSVVSPLAPRRWLTAGGDDALTLWRALIRARCGVDAAR